MTWTNEKPTKPGYYGFRVTANVKDIPLVQISVWPGGGLAAKHPLIEWKSVDFFCLPESEWCGPIQLPWEVAS
jgi:hypothetical protein